MLLTAAFIAAAAALLAIGALYGEVRARKAAEAKANDLAERLVGTLAALQSERVWLSAARGPAVQYLRDQQKADAENWRANFSTSD
jgi:hypothetical protein